MAHRQLLTNEERRALFGIPLDPDGMARRFTLSGVTTRFVQNCTLSRQGLEHRANLA